MAGWDSASQTLISAGQYYVHNYNPTTRNITSILIQVCGGNNFGGLWNYGYVIFICGLDRCLVSSFASSAVANVLADKRVMVLTGLGMNYLWNITDPAAACLTNISTAGQLGGSPGVVNVHAPGIDYYPAENTLVGYAGDSPGVYVLNTTTYRWKYRPSSPNNTVIPPVTNGGIFSRWRYVPDYDVFVVAYSYERSVYFYKPNTQPPEDCDPLLRPVEPRPDAWDCINGLWRYTSSLSITPAVVFQVKTNITISGNLDLSGTLSTIPTATVTVTGCIRIANGSSIDLSGLTYEQAKELGNITVAISSSRCVENPTGLSKDPALTLQGASACETVTADPYVDKTRGSLSLVFSFNTVPDCGKSNLAQNGGLPVWGIALIVLAIIGLTVGTVVAVLTIPGLRRRFIPTFQMNSRLRSMARASMQPRASITPQPAAVETMTPPAEPEPEKKAPPAVPARVSRSAPPPPPPKPGARQSFQAPTN